MLSVWQCAVLEPWFISGYKVIVNRIKPGQLANALGITTDALRKQRMRDTSPYEYEVIEGRVLYDLDTLPQGVRIT